MTEQPRRRNTVSSCRSLSRHKCCRRRGGEGLIFNFLYGTTLRESFQMVAVRGNTVCHEKYCSVTAMIEYREAAASMQCALACWISGFLLPSFLQKTEIKEVWH